MAEGRQKAAWNHTSSLLAMFYNAFRGRGSRALGPSDFHPFEKPAVKKTTLAELAYMGILSEAHDDG